MRFESLPSDLQEYWNTTIQSCGSWQAVNLQLTCYMYYSGEKSPFRSSNSIKTITMKRKKRRSMVTIASECCETACTRWNFKDYCWSDDPEIYRPRPQESSTTAAPPTTKMSTTTRRITTRKLTTTSTTTTTTTTEKPRKKIYFMLENC